MDSKKGRVRENHLPSWFCDSVCGAIMLVGGLYVVLWGKNKEGKRQTDEGKSKMSEGETVLE